MEDNITKISLAHQTMFAELINRCLMSNQDKDKFPLNGSFVKVLSHGKHYWYYNGNHIQADGKKQYRFYVGPVDDPTLHNMVMAFKEKKETFKERRQMVLSLMAIGLPSPSGFVGNIVNTLYREGFFRLRGVLIGTLAFQTYAGLLGVKVPNATLMTGDIDFAQFHSISCCVDDKMDDIGKILSSLDKSFRPVPHIGSRTLSTKYINKDNFQVEFLTPNRGSDENQGHPTKMPALGDHTGAEPLRFLDFLIYYEIQRWGF